MLTNQGSKDIVFLMLIAGRKQKDSLLTELLKDGAHIVNTMYGKGSAKSSYIRDVLGLVHEENKIVITCVMTKEKSNAMLEILAEKFNFNKPNTGIAFTVPVEKLSF